MNIVSIGEILWDIFEDAERIGGATFNFSAQAARLGHHVSFVSAVGDDDHGQKALQRIDELNLSTRFVKRVTEAPTGTVSVFVNEEGQPDFTIHRPAAYDFTTSSRDDFAALTSSPVDWVYFGSLSFTGLAFRQLLLDFLEAATPARRIFDINLRKDCYSPELIGKLLPLATMMKINDEEVASVRDMFGEAAGTIEDFCRLYLDRYGLDGVCVTRGAQGCSLLLRNEFVEAPACAVEVADTVGAGDAFTAALIHGLGQNWEVEKVADFANRVGALVASREGGVPDWSVEEAT